jgi:type III secretion protein N (ATPase)
VAGIAPGDAVHVARERARLGPALLGCACDAAHAVFAACLPVQVQIAPGDRRAPSEIAWTGVRAIDGPLAFARGARIGLFGAPGCGKSTLLEAIASGAAADAVVVGLIGERGREAERWFRRVDARMTVICATSDRAPAERVHAAELAFAHADALRRRGLHVLLIVDSLARTAAAQREIALALGEPAGRGGYPPSVFALLARLLEVGGAFAHGSLTIVATVLSDGADEREPVSEAARAALDGHIALSEALARRGWFPAIDLPASASRTLGEVASAEHLHGARLLRAAVAILDETSEARRFGLDPGAADPALARALAAEAAIEKFLRAEDGPSGATATLAELSHLATRLDDGYYS